MRRPIPVRSGIPGLDEFQKAVVEALQRLEIHESPSIRPSVNGMGTTLDIVLAQIPQRLMAAVAAAGPSGQPFTCSIVTIPASGDNPATDYLSIVPGVLNQLMPSNMVGAVEAYPNLPYQNLLADALQFVVLTATVEASGGGYIISSCDISVSATQPAPNSVGESAPPSGAGAFSILLAVIAGSAVGSRSLYQIATGNIWAIPQVAFIAPATPSGPGDEPFTRYWQWTIIQANET
jgi:hypothetical protein